MYSVALSGYPDFPSLSKSYPDFCKNLSDFHYYLGGRTTMLTAYKPFSSVTMLLSISITFQFGISFSCEHSAEFYV